MCVCVTNINRQTKSKIERTFTTCDPLPYPYHVVLLYLLMLFEKLENIFFTHSTEEKNNKTNTCPEERELICKKEVDFLGINEVKKQFLIIWQNGNISKTLK